MNEIIKISHYSEKSARVRIANRLVASKAAPGQFVIIKFSTDGMRIPFPIVEWDANEGFLDVIIHRGDGLDEILGHIEEGSVLPDLLGPLGRPAQIENGKSLLFIGDGPGFVPLLPLIRESRKAGCHVHSLVSEKSSLTKCLVGDIYEDCENLEIVNEENVVDVARRWIETHNISKLIYSGPTMMMKDLAELARSRSVAADCVLNMLMIDGIGLCGVCRVMVGGKQLNTCIDGPVFDALEVDFDYILNRQRSFV